jgi:hypothetical protein
MAVFEAQSPLMLAHFLKWHHRLGVLTCLALLLWGLSGVTHPLMSRWQPRPASSFPPDQSISLSAARSLPDVLQARGWERIQAASLATVAGHPHYRVTVAAAEPAHYLDVQTGAELPDGERLHAEELARHYTGLKQAKIVSSRLVQAFDADYHPTNRLLPVWRIQFDQADELTAYIDVGQARLATLVDQRRRLMTTWFKFGHDWSFLSGLSGLRLAAMTTALALVAFSALSGLWFFVRMRGSAATRLARKPLARWHRWLGGLVGVTTVAFTLSGTLHLWMKQRHDALERPAVAQQGIATADLTDAGWRAITAPPLARLELLSHGHQAAWLMQVARPGQASGPKAQVAAMAQARSESGAASSHDEHAGHGDKARRKAQPSATPTVMLHDTRSGAPLPGGPLEWAGQLAQGFASQGGENATRAVESSRWITRFDDEYGFVNKRLPVVRVTLRDDPSHTRYFIEPATGTLAARVDDMDLLEGRIFSWLHKWRFTDAGKDIRDLLQALVVLTTVGVALGGLLLFIRRQRRLVPSKP